MLKCNIQVQLIRVLGAASAGAISEVQVATAMIAADAVNGDKLADDACNSEHYTGWFY